MIRKLRRKFILVASACILLILSIVIIFINVISYYSGYKEAMSILSYILDHNGRMPDKNPLSSDVDFFVSRELRFETRYFSIITDINGNYINSDNEHIYAVTDKEAETMYMHVLAKNKLKGRIKISNGVFLYKVKEISGKELSDTLFSRSDLSNLFENDANYKLIIFMDCTNRFYRLRSVQTLSLLIGVLCFVMFVLLVSVFSGFAVKPVAENYEKQKKFITNAGHELKTPLTIISANSEVIEAMNGESEWTQSIRNQVDRLTGLVTDLITIARLDEVAERQDLVMIPFNLSDILHTLTEDFSTVAEQQEKTLDTDITQGIEVNGNEKLLRELISILLDNAVKYCDEGGTVRVKLTRQRNHACLIISNTYAKKTECTRYFDRFYREDTSHSSEKAGYGIGLSMAETIIRLHKGKITAQQKEETVYFTVLL